MKKLLLLLVAFATIACVSCKKDAASSAVSGEQSDSVAAETSTGAPVPTGNPEQDAKVMVDYMLQAVGNIKTLDDMLNLEKSLESLEQQYQDTYKDKPEDLAKFNAAYDKYGQEKNLGELMTKKAEEVTPEGMGDEPTDAEADAPAEEPAK